MTDQEKIHCIRGKKSVKNILQHTMFFFWVLCLMSTYCAYRFVTDYEPSFVINTLTWSFIAVAVISLVEIAVSAVEVLKNNKMRTN